MFGMVRFSLPRKMLCGLCSTDPSRPGPRNKWRALRFQTGTKSTRVLWRGQPFGSVLSRAKPVQVLWTENVGIVKCSKGRCSFRRGADGILGFIRHRSTT
jgi:hypothetical protein